MKITALANVRVKIVSDGVETELPTEEHAKLALRLDPSGATAIKLDSHEDLDLAGLVVGDARFTFTLDSPIQWGGKSYDVSF